MAHKLSSNEKLPTGTITFLFTDIVGSTPLWESQPDLMAEALEIHNTALRGAIEAHGGTVFKTVGDAFQAAFPTAPQALRAAIAGQSALQDAAWNELGELKVRMGLHTGEAELDSGGDEYAVSHTKNRVARIMSAAHGGQILLSDETAKLVDHHLTGNVTLKDLGEHRLKGMGLPERLYQVAAPGLITDFPPLGTETRIKHNLPIELTSFIGRKKQVVRVKDLINQHRMVTLTGSGGVGKTRLSIRVAQEMLEDFPGGVWYIELAPISDPDRVNQSVASTLGLREDPNKSLLEMLGEYFKNRQTLLVLDNCEHLVEACAELADHLLSSSPRVKIFASSREALGINGEIPYSVPSLLTPDPNHLPDLDEFKNFEAVKLFAERARVANPSFQIEVHNMPAIAQICHRLDGIPLALELAAARLNMLTTAQMASRLDNAFRLLTGGSRTALPRQQTLQSTIDWSYQLLDENERTIMRRMGVFAGSFNLEGAERVCAGDGLEGWEIFDLLASLIDKSIVSAERDRGEEMRYRMLETVRQYARQKLYESGESQVSHDRHLAYFLDLAETIEPQLRTSVALERLSHLTLEAPNLRAALSWAIEGQETTNIEKGLRLASVLLNFWHTQNFQREGFTWLNTGLLALPNESSFESVRARACFAAGHLVFPLGRFEESKEWLSKSLIIYQHTGNSTGIVMAQSMLGETLCRLGLSEKGKELCETSLATCRTLDDSWLLAWVLNRYGQCFDKRYEPSPSRQFLEESLSLFKKEGDVLQLGGLYVSLGLTALYQRDLNQSQYYYNRAMISSQDMQSQYTLALALWGLGTTNYFKGDYIQMEAFLLESVALNRETSSTYLSLSLNGLGFAELKLCRHRLAAQFFIECFQFENIYEKIVSLVGIMGSAVQIGNYSVAACLLGAIRQLLDLHNLNLSLYGHDEYEYCWSVASEQLNTPVFDSALSEGEAMTLEEAVAYAVSFAEELINKGPMMIDN